MKTHERLYLIDKLLREKKYANLEKIKKILNNESSKQLSERQFLRDISELKSKLQTRYPKETDDLLFFNRIKKGYQYKDGFSAFSDFSKQEIKSFADLISELKDLQHIFKGGKNMALYEKIKALAIEQEYAKGNENISWSPVSLIKEGVRSGQEYFDELLECIKSQRTIEIEYRKLGQESKIINCLPILIKEYNSGGWFTGWYLLALPIYEGTNFYTLSTNDLNVYAIDRIEKISESKLKPKFNNHTKFKPEEYFKYIFGLFRNNLGKNKSIKRHIIHIESIDNNWIYDYILKYPIHSTQTILTNNKNTKYIKFKIEMELTIDLENYLYQHASQLRVIKPKILRDKIITRLQTALVSY